jgi:hypothetical protein
MVKTKNGNPWCGNCKVSNVSRRVPISRKRHKFYPPPHSVLVGDCTDISKTILDYGKKFNKAGHTTIFNIIDYTTKYLWSFLLHTKHAPIIIDKLVHVWDDHLEKKPCLLRFDNGGKILILTFFDLIYI